MRLYFISSAIAYCISPYARFYAGLSCLNKKRPEFWKAWHRKFSKSVCKNTNINGLNDNGSIANAFRSQFGAVAITLMRILHL